MSEEFDYSSGGSDIEDLDIDDIEQLDDEEEDEQVVEGVVDEEEEEEEEEEEDFEDEEEEERIDISDLTMQKEIIGVDEMYNDIASKSKKTHPVMSIYEFTKLIGVRSQQLAAGMPSTVIVPNGHISTKEIAIRELKENKLPLMVRRYLPNGQYEDWPSEELLLPKTVMI